MFRIEYVKTLKPERPSDLGRYMSIMRVLKEDKTYWFYQSNYTLPKDFWSKGYPKVNVCAVVGENGSGKSSVIELMLRLMNNTAYALKNGIGTSKSNRPRFVRDVYAELGFETDKGHYTIRQEDIEIMLSKDGSLIWRYDYTKRNGDRHGLENIQGDQVEDYSRECLADLFYTIVVNYSFYSYNTEDYRREMIGNEELESDEMPDEIFEEDRCWLSGIFHKNDGYQMPLVLNPYRLMGNLNINNENELTQNRMFLLAIANDSPLQYIWSNKTPYSFCFDIKTDYQPIEEGMLYTSKMVRLQMLELGYISDWKKEPEKVEALGKRIIESWNKYLGFSLCEKKVGMDEQDWKVALNYIVYKTIKISLNYGKYTPFRDCLIHQDKRDKDQNLEIEEYIKLLHDENTHITLKLFRAIAFIKFGHYGTSMSKAQDETELASNEILLSDFGRRIERCLSEDKEEPQNLEMFPGLEELEWKDELLLPASCFHTDMKLILTKKEKNDDRNADESKGFVMYSSLSSGEKQVVNTLCTAVYHIHNLKSKWETKNEDPKHKEVKYRYVNLIFDELELYFHPKYQTMLVEMLLNAIKSLDLKKNFKGINVIYATHSPFILSDIPIQNILGMDGGNPHILDNIDNTFCANVYDILASGFFMKKFVGNYAEAKFDELVSKLNRRKRLSSREVDIIKNTISLIGDEFLRWKLTDLLNEREA